MPRVDGGGAVKEFLFWLNLFVVLLIVVFVVFFVVAYATGGLGDTEQQILVGGILAVFALSGLGYALDPNSEPIKRRRRW